MNQKKTVAGILLCLWFLALHGTAAPVECASTSKGVASMSRWLSGDERTPIREYKVAQYGPMSIYNVASVFEGLGENNFSIYYGFTYAYDLGDLLNISDYLELYSLFDQGKPDRQFLETIIEELRKKESELVSAMDILWEDPRPGQEQSYDFVGEKVTVKILGRDTIENFPDSDGKTSVIRVELKFEEGITETTSFSSEYCMDVAFEYSDDEITGKDELLGFVSSDERQAEFKVPRSPEELIQRTSNAFKYLDFDAVANLTDDESMERLKSLVLAAYEQNKVNELSQLGFRLGKKMTIKDIESAPAKDTYKRLMRSIASNPAILHSFLVSDIKFIDIVKDEADKTIAVVKIISNIGNTSIETTDTVPISRTSNGGWALSINKSVQYSVFHNLGVKIDQSAGRN